MFFFVLAKVRTWYQYGNTLYQVFFEQKRLCRIRDISSMDKTTFTNALTRLKTEDGVSPVQFAKDIGVSYDTLNNLKRGRQRISKELLATISRKYPQFEAYALADQQRGDNTGQASPDEQAEEMKQIVEKLTQIVDDYVKRNSTLEDWYSKMKEDYKTLNEKYIQLLEELRK